jgi:hypothetical protein
MSDGNSRLISRRDLFKRTAAVGAAAVGTGWALAACDGGGDGEKELSCTDVSGLKSSEIQTRSSLQYVDKSSKPDQNCANCQFYEPKGKNQCGGCTVVPGPIHPKGWCTSWAAKQA